jgi:hypothetical protein
MAPHWQGSSRACRVLASHLLVDPSYAVGKSGYEDGRPRHLHYLEAGITLWLAWQAAIVTGFVAGARVPDSLHLEHAPRSSSSLTSRAAPVPAPPAPQPRWPRSSPLARPLARGDADGVALAVALVVTAATSARGRSVPVAFTGGLLSLWATSALAAIVPIGA